MNLNGDKTMNKAIAILIILVMMILPSFSTAQNNGIPEEIQDAIEANWRLIPARTVMWIGESLAIVVNGSANTSFALDLRRFNTTTHVLYNASYSARGYTDENGTILMVIPDYATEESGEYRIQVIINMLAVAFQDIQVNYDPQRYDELQRENIWDYLGINSNNVPSVTIQDYINSSKDYDKYEMAELQKAVYRDYVIITLLVIIILASFQTWVNQFAEWRKKQGKGSFTLRIMSRAEDRTRDYGGAVIGGSPPKISNNCIGLTKAIDENQDIEWNLKDKTSDEVMPQVMINAKKLGVKMPAKAKHESKAKIFNKTKTPDVNKDAIEKLKSDKKENKEKVKLHKKTIKIRKKETKAEKKRLKEIAKLDKKDGELND